MNVGRVVFLFCFVFVFVVVVFYPLGMNPVTLPIHSNLFMSHGRNYFFSCSLGRATETGETDGTTIIVTVRWIWRGAKTRVLT